MKYDEELIKDGDQSCLFCFVPWPSENSNFIFYVKLQHINLDCWQK